MGRPAGSGTLHHHRSGSGPPLVLIHGVGHHWQGWRPVIDRMTADFDVIACDSPGFGRSAPLPAGAEPTVPAYVDAFAAFFAEIGIERPHVAGNSMGGAIALELARRGAVASATAFSPAGFWSAGERRYCQVSLGALAAMPKAVQPAVSALARTRVGRAALYAQLVARPGAMTTEEAVGTLRDAWAAPAFAGALRAFDHYDFTDGRELDTEAVPVTVAWGDKDRLLLYGRQASRARIALPQAQHVTLDAGHVPFADAPDAVAATIRATVSAKAPR